ncbi:MAG: DUF763 domain-containing protein [Cyclobacteriaceae bacterium]
MKPRRHADLPLHHGRVPKWLAKRMSILGGAIMEAIVVEYGKEEVFRRLSDPFWFQSLGCVLGMDWHSSGITTSVMGALKTAINPRSKELGIYICGGRGKHSRQTPSELLAIADQTGLDGNHLVRCSKLSAKVDNTAIQDGFQLYLHSFILSSSGEWAVVQQGMDQSTRMARRYHWHSTDFESFIEEPHTSVYGQNKGQILNLTHKKANPTREGLLEVTREAPKRILPEIAKLVMPRHHEVKSANLNLKRLGSVLALAHETGPSNFESLLLLQGVGPRTIQSLTLVSEVIYGTPSRFSDPARFSFAHGGKDGHPFPVPTKVYDQTIDHLNNAINRAKIGLTDKTKALKKLHSLSVKLEESFIPNNNFDRIIAREKAKSHLYGGRTVKGFVGPTKNTKQQKNKGQQLVLF